MGELASPLAERAAPTLPFAGRRSRHRPQVSFADLVWAHRIRTDARAAGASPDDDRERRFQEALAAFQERHGEITEVYWCSHETSAVALTRTRPNRLLRLLGRRARSRIHRVSDWETQDAPVVAEMLHRCDLLALKADEVLRETNQRVAVHWAYALMTHLLGVVDSARGKLDVESTATLRTEFEEELGGLNAYYESVGVRAGQIVYFWGMTAGLAVLAVAGLLLLPLLDALGVASVDMQNFYGCYAAGALGAFVSVIQRVTEDNFRVDYEAGRQAISRVGSFRPVIGAVFGVVLYFALESGLLHIEVPGSKDSEHFAFLVVAAFAAGFSERLAKDVLENVGEGVAGDGADPAPPATAC